MTTSAGRFRVFFGPLWMMACLWRPSVGLRLASSGMRRFPSSRGSRRCVVTAASEGGPRTVGFVGLGIMGDGMSRNLLVAGRNLVVWNRSPEKSTNLQREFGEERVEVAETPMEVVERVDIIYTMLSTPEASNAVYHADRGILAGLEAAGSRRYIVDCATLTEDDMASLSRQVHECHGSKFLEAPVSGSKGPAEAGQLIFLSAGDREVFEDPAVAEDLAAMGKASYYLGDVGKGTRMKLVVNLIMGTMLGALAEGMKLGSTAGLDENQLVEILGLGAMANPMFALKGPKMIANDHAPNFPLKHATKDMVFACEMAEQLGSSDSIPTCRVSTKEFQSRLELGYGDDDFSAIYKD